MTPSLTPHVTLAKSLPLVRCGLITCPHGAPLLPASTSQAQAILLETREVGAAQGSLACEHSWPHSGTARSVPIVRPGDPLKSLQAKNGMLRSWPVPHRALCPSKLLNSLCLTLHPQSRHSDRYCPTRQERKDKVYEELYK